MPQVLANGIRLEYESLGRDDAPPILLIMGLGCQLIHWPDALCQQLVDAGYRVIRYDNRDIGLSEKMDRLGKPNVMRAGLAEMLRLPVKTAYSIDDMANDAAGLLDALGIERAHVVGASMGGMIGQVLAAKHSQRVLSFTCIMSTAGDRSLRKASLKLQMRLARRPERVDREGLIEHSMRTWQLIGSPSYPTPEPELRANVSRIFDRNFHPRGLARQTVAILAHGSRTPLLRRIAAPTLVIHGEDDPLVPVPAAHHLGRHIAGSRVEIIKGMGHDFPTALMPRIATLVIEHAGRAH